MRLGLSFRVIFFEDLNETILLWVSRSVIIWK